MARQQVTPGEIEREAQSFPTRPPAFTTATHYPYPDLTDRQFEVLLYFVFLEDIKRGVFDGQFDAVYLMQGVGERGRDCALFRQGRSAGLVQGKNHDDRMHRPAVAREVIRFVLHYLLDQTLMHDPKSFVYYLAAASDFGEKALALFQDFPTVVEDPDFDGWLREELGKSKAFAKLTLEGVRDRVVEILRVLTVKPIGPADLDLKLKTYQHLLPLFFQVQMVVSREGLLSDLSRVLQQFGITPIADQELRRLNERLAQVPEAYRLNLGVFNLFGFNQEMLKRVASTPRFAEMLRKGTEFRDSLDEVVLVTLREFADRAIYDRITPREDISTVGKSIALGYVVSSLVREFEQRILPDFLQEALREHTEWRQRDPLELARASALKTAECVLKNDFSSFRLAFAQEMANAIYGGFHSLGDVELRLKADFEVMVPILREIVDEGMRLLPFNPTVIVG